MSLLYLALSADLHAAPLTAGDPIALPGTKGGFDFIRIDTAANRLLLGHTGNKSFDVFDLSTRKLLRSVPTSTAQDATTDVKGGKYYVSGNDPSRMVIVDSASLEITGEVPTPADTDLIGFNPDTGLVYECNTIPLLRGAALLSVSLSSPYNLITEKEGVARGSAGPRFAPSN